MEEQELYKEFYQSIILLTALDVSNLFSKKYQRNIKLKILNFQNIFRLPDYKDYQTQIGFLFTSTQLEISAGIILNVQKNINIYKFGNINFQANLKLTSLKNFAIALNAAKLTKYG